MELPENVVPMPAEQRAELKRLAEAATPGPWAYRSQEFDDWGVVRGPLREDGHRVHLAKVAAPYASREQMQAHREAKTDPYETNGQYIAAVSPDITLATLSYVEALEAKVEELRADQMKQMEGGLDMKSFICTQGEELSAAKKALDAATARATKAESRVEELKVEVLDILRDMRLPVLPFPKDNEVEAAIALGRNQERQAVNDYCRQKAYEYDRGGIGPDPTEVGQWDTRPAAPTPPPSSPAAAGPVRSGKKLPLAGPAQMVGSVQIPEGFEFVARWPTSRVDLAMMANLYGEDARCCAPGPNGGLPLIIRPALPSIEEFVAGAAPTTTGEGKGVSRG